MSVDTILKGKYHANVVDALISAYKEIENNYTLGKWKASELDAGHFVEAARRMLEFELFGQATPIGSNLPNFNEVVLKGYQQAQGDESLRILIPRLLWSIYGIRNKRGVGHLGTISPNKMDCSLILSNVKWVLAEFVRLASGLTSSETQTLIDEIVQRELGLLWKHGDTVRVLNSKLTAREKILLLLYDKSPQKLTDLRTAIEYANTYDFKRIAKKLHSSRHIELTSDETCIITALGILAAERVVNHNKLYI